MEIEEIKKKLLQLEGYINVVNLCIMNDEPESWLQIGIAFSRMDILIQQLLLDGITFSHQKFNPIPGLRNEIPPTSSWNLENWKFKSRDQVRGLTEEDFLKEWKELADAIKLFTEHNAPWSMQMSWTFSAFVAIATERGIELNTKTDSHGNEP